MPDPRLEAILTRLRATGFAELAGASAAISIPLPAALLTELAAAAVPPSAPFRALTIQPRDANRVRVSAKLKRAEFLPPISLTVEIERQPELPDRPLVLRLLSIPGVLAIAGGALSMAATLPPGIRFEQERVFVDVQLLLQRQGFGEWLKFISALRVRSEEGRVVVDLTLGA